MHSCIKCWWIQYCTCMVQQIEHDAMWIKSIKYHWLLLLDSGLCIAKPWMLCICYCTNSIKLHQLGDFLVHVDCFWWIHRRVSSENALGFRVKQVQLQQRSWQCFMLHLVLSVTFRMQFSFEMLSHATASVKAKKKSLRPLLVTIHKVWWLREASQNVHTPMWKSHLKHSMAEFQSIQRFWLQLEIVS